MADIMHNMVMDSSLSSLPGKYSAGLNRDRSALGTDAIETDRRQPAIPKSLRRPQKEDFVFVKLLGRGSIGTVIKAMHKESGNVYAMKVIHKDHIDKNGLRSQLLAEVKIQMTIRHQNLLRCYSYFEDEDRVYLVLELATGGDLYQYLKKGPLSQEDAAFVFAQVATGIQHLHSHGIAHRDLKPENIMLGRDLKAKIADFGCVSQKSARSTLCGTACILAPEMIVGLSYDHRVDVWALGVLLFEMVVGFSPFESGEGIIKTCERIMKEDLQGSVLERVPIVVRPLIGGLLQRNPDERMPISEALQHPWIVGKCAVRAATARAANANAAKSPAPVLQIGKKEGPLSKWARPEHVSTSRAPRDENDSGNTPKFATSPSTPKHLAGQYDAEDVGFEPSAQQPKSQAKGAGVHERALQPFAPPSRGRVPRDLEESDVMQLTAACVKCGLRLPMDVASIEQHAVVCDSAMGTYGSGPPSGPMPIGFGPMRKALPGAFPSDRGWA
mmetsp:Transcript_21344/g.39048  ORF Transcript_21344/g.39048 Transcript_21344/m.39048 type:complete len:499 (-) Transcript_21344:392-1888(-)